MSETFDDIRPYRDAEVRPVLDRVLANPELVAAMTRLRLPRWPRVLRRLLVPLVRRRLARQLAGVQSVRDFQQVVEHYMSRMIRQTVSSFTVSGLDQLQPGQSYLFVSNHRDIAMDPAFVNYALYHNGHDTVRIAIGDNLLTKDYAADLMRLNKSFIVKRSVTGMKALLQASRHLAAYMRFSVQQERQSVWIAQREGRAKDGCDRTEPAVIKMIALAQERKSETLTEFVRGMRIVPVAIAYEFDPCDQAKAHELLARARTGQYRKGEHEDVASIAQGIAGYKGAVHLAFGQPLAGEYADIEAVVAELDRQIVGRYHLHASNRIAWERLHGRWPSGLALDLPAAALAAAARRLDARLAGCEAEARPYLLAMYANAVQGKLDLVAG